MSAISTLLLVAVLVGFVLVERNALNGQVAAASRVQSLGVKARELSLYVQYNAHDTNAYTLGHVEHREEYVSHAEQFGRVLDQIRLGLVSGPLDRNTELALHRIRPARERYDRASLQLFRAADHNRRDPTPTNQQREDAAWAKTDTLGDQLDELSQVLTGAIATQARELQEHIEAQNARIIPIVLALALLIGGLILLIQSGVAHARAGAESAGRRAQELLSQNQSILNAAGDGIYGLDTEGRETFANPAAARLTGREVGDLLGLRAHDIVHHTRADGTPYPQEESPIWQSLQDGTSCGCDSDVFWRKDGSSFPVEYTSTPISENGMVKGAVVVFRDITERRQTEELLERQRRQLIEAQSIGGFGSWDWDIAADTIEWSDQLCRIYGLDPGSHPATLDEMLERTHPDDRALMQAVVQRASETGEAFSFEQRIVRSDGVMRTAQARGHVISDASGTPLRMLGTAQDVTERREVERAKDEFTSVVSHELRTPLTSIRGSLGLLESGVLGALPEKGRRMVKIAVQNTDRLVRLINDILDIERIDAGTIDMHPELCDAAELIEQAVQGVAQLAADAQVSLIADGEPVALFAAPDRVIQTLTNLISNAVKFSPSGASVHVCWAVRENEVLFEVTDEGRGIPNANLESIFERFQQVDASDSREKGGTGLGLAICRTIVEHHGGRIWVNSTLGIGSTFSFVLPGVSDERLADAEPSAGDGPLVLVCDDDAGVVEVVATILTQRGYRVIEAHCGEQALQRAVAEQPDAILLDLLMPGMSGWETAAALKRHRETDDIPIVILSVLSEAESEGLSAPTADWLEKPLDEGALFEALERVINAREEPFKVLIVENDADLAEILTAMFERHEIQASIAADGREAIELCQQILPDLLVLDIGLPETDGFEVVDWLRRHERLRALPMVVYTARELDAQDRERLRLGASTEFLTKGQITPQDFEQRVTRLLGRLTRTPTPTDAR